MSKAIAAISALTLGSATFGFLLYLQTHPRAFTSDTPAVTVEASRDVEVLRVTPAEIAASTEPSNEVLHLEPMVIWGNVPVLRAIPKPAAEEEIPFATIPCSEWSELGPKASTKLPGSRHFRDLCI